MSTPDSSEPTIESWIEESFSDSGQAALDLLPEDAPFYRRYGNYTLRRGDWDGSWPSAPVEEGREIGLANGDLVLPGIVVDPAEEQPPTISLGGYVTQLQLDLWNLGFGLIREFDGVFGPRTEQAVREFQIYAGMGRVAEEDPKAAGEYVERLSGTDNPEGSMTRYTGEVTGVLNQETRRCLTHWINEGYRCPVVITARTGDEYASVYDGDAMAEGADPENLWGHDDLQSNSPRVFAVDFTDYYDLPSEPDSSDPSLDGIRHFVLGEYNSYEGDEGPVSQQYHTWNEGEITPQRLIGTPGEHLTEADQSTYDVVHAVSHIECMGYFDSVNAYDRALVSVGPCHWTLGLADSSGGVGGGELCGYLAYLQECNPNAFEKAFGRFGLGLNHQWGNWEDPGGSPDGSTLYDDASRTYSSWVQLPAQDLDPEGKGSDEESSEEMQSMPKAPPDAKSEALYFKSWHWFYRFVMAGRTVEPYRQRMWDMARVRIRDLRSASLPLEAPEKAEWSPEEITIGDIFTSEKAMVMVYCWHIYSPSDVFPLVGQSCLEEVFDHASSGYHDVHEQYVDQEDEELQIQRQLTINGEEVDGARLDWSRRPGSWSDRHELALIGGLLQRSSGEIRRRIGLLFLDEHQTLDEGRGSFAFADAGLPESP
ncbi:hypothetical protein BSZ35_12595 [Salinibacter sp. 10B]|uniref:peptidoglycan-binding domain-containing protein n=1 Tax=Salinibacter sp. 10B TaxID=1923971 RepID=UPI000CF3BD28|nr:peptidoglycan-binding protein [Salinibacter sp. 10B]PQJ35328.1 hypothetical protein BSZ35_12595 [Salinibacter sp. 10B]